MNQFKFFNYLSLFKISLFELIKSEYSESVTFKKLLCDCKTYGMEINTDNLFYSTVQDYTQGIIEGDQIQVAAFSLECFSYLTGLTLGQ